MPHVGKAFELMNNLVIPELETLGAQSFLYVGWRPHCSPWWKDHFASRLNIQRIGIIEIYAPNYHAAKDACPWANVMHGDVRELEKHVFPGEYDIIYWDHGPEHVPTADLIECTPRLFALAGKALVYSCPWGDWPQGPEGGNENETHYVVDDNDLRNIGMKVIGTGNPGQSNLGELIAYMTKP